MRRLALILLIGIFVMFCMMAAHAQNRVATLLDVAKYGTFITEGDLILDKPTNPVPFADGINQLRYTKVSSSFPTMRENAIIWVDGNKLQSYCEFRLLNGNETTPWHISSATIKPIPGTRMNGIVTANSYGGFCHLIQGLKNMRLEGTSKEFPGLSEFPAERKFTKGSFGISATSKGYYGGYHMFSLSVLNGGTMHIDGVEGEHGFSVLRLQGGSYDWTVTIHIENCYTHDTGSEGFYIGATHGPPLAKIKATIKNCFFARTGSESLQLQHLVGDSYISNITIYSADAGYLNQFQPNQDTGIQLNPAGGTTTLKNVVLDGWGSNGVNLFGSAFTTAGAKTKIENNLLINGRGPAIYIHNSAKYHMDWTIDSLTISKPNGEFFINNKMPALPWLISNNNGTDTFRISNIKFDGLVTLFQNTSKLIITDLFKTTPADIEYINTGFPEPAHKIKFYTQFYAKYFSGVDNKPAVYKPGDILEDMEPLHEPVFVKVLQEFTATDVRAKNRPECMVLTWDAAGIRNDQPKWNAAAVQKLYPPDDLRVKRSNYYGRLNIGVVEEAPLVDDLLLIIQKKDSTINVLQGKLTGIFTELEKYK